MDERIEIDAWGVVLPPGRYVFTVRALTLVIQVPRENYTVQQPYYFGVPVTVEAGLRYVLKRIGTGAEEEVIAQPSRFPIEG